MDINSTDRYCISRTKRILFYIFIAVFIIGFIMAEVIYPSERSASTKVENLAYEGSFSWIKDDGTSEQIEVPGRYDVKPGDVMAIETVLPEDFSQNTIAIRASLQTINFYVDGVKRASYDTKDTRPFGENSASRYVFCNMSDEDAGCTLRIELTTKSSNYSGVVNAIYCGDKGDIWAYIFSSNGAETIIAFFILFAGVLTVIFSIALNIVYGTKFDMEYLGWCMLLGAVWMLGESKLRQLLVPNASILAAMCFVVILICPIAILFYVDSVQKGRYSKYFHYIEALAAINFLVCTFMQIAGIKDFIDTLPAAQIMLAVCFVAVIVTFIIDIKEKRAHEYGLVMVGMLIAFTLALIEAASVYFVVSLSGIFIGTGLMILLLVNIISTIRSVSEMEIRRKKEEKEQSIDYLTGLPMRSRGQKMAAAMMQETDGCLIFIDMDNLKKINDIYGHKAGDRALKLIGDTLTDERVFCDNAVAGRLGGDEFLMFVPMSEPEAEHTIRTIFDIFETKKNADSEIKPASLSAGLCMTKRGSHFEEAYANADKALYNVKQNGKGSYLFYHQMISNSPNNAGTGKDLQRVAKSLKKSGSYTGALDLNYRDFAKLYEYMNSLGERYKHNCYLVMVTMESMPEQVMYIESMEEALGCMEKAIRERIRKVDICTRYSSIQYLIILFEPMESQIPNVMDRIFTQYYRLYNKADFKPKYEYIKILEESKA